MSSEGAARSYTTTIHYYDGSSREALVTDQETVFPRGELIVSQTDARGIITTCNDAFVLMSGYSKEELIGAPHSILRHPDMPAVAFADLWETVQAGKRWHGYVKNLRKDGGFYWVHAVVIPKIRDGVIIGHTSVRREPSREKIAEAAAAYAELRAKRGMD
ncbi:PAS domain-containing protein [Propionibacterium sp. oral taxon 192]|uniref:PAS domain-containing protein n=1 Tax=Propionibacterium sp. oral taxon 192 TaxID=671222 RepID=UPI000565AC02|nr:PAS domain-containing protein [Propionibacterium sp. oral taxon 192]